MILPYWETSHTVMTYFILHMDVENIFGHTFFVFHSHSHGPWHKLIFNASLCVAEIQLPVMMNPTSRWYHVHMKHRVMNHDSNRLAQVVQFIPPSLIFSSLFLVPPALSLSSTCSGPDHSPKMTENHHYTTCHNHTIPQYWETSKRRTNNIFRKGLSRHRWKWSG